MFSYSLKMVKACRNMSALRKIVCKNAVLTLVPLFVRLCEKLAKFVSEPTNFPKLS